MEQLCRGWRGQRRQTTGHRVAAVFDNRRRIGCSGCCGAVGLGAPMVAVMGAGADRDIGHVTWLVSDMVVVDCKQM